MRSKSSVGLRRKMEWIRKIHREGGLEGRAMTGFVREVYEIGDLDVLSVLGDLLGDLLFADVMDVCNHRARFEGDNNRGYKVVRNRPN